MRILTAILGPLEVVERDGPDAPAGIHDFDLVNDHGHVIAVEATSHMSESLTGYLMEAHKGRQHVEGLNGTWWLTPIFMEGRDQPPNLKAALGDLPRLLNRLAALGVTDSMTVNVNHPNPEVGALLDELHELKIDSIERVSEDGSAVHWLFIATGWVDADLPAYVAELHLGVIDPARGADNVAKLHRAEADERHLFIEVANATADMARSAVDHANPQRGPLLPDGIDVVWVNGLHKILSFTEAEGWQAHDQPLAPG